ncbi:MAG: asparaginase [Burkholderiaceae bacterium]
MAKKIVVLGTGGTIAGRATSAGDNLGYTAAQVGIAELLAGIPALAGTEVVSEQVAQIDSKDMDFATWSALARRCAHWLAEAEVAGIVVTHGTDTLEETAYFLQAVLAPAKPVVITCAMRPATALAPDGPQNVLDAVTAARSGFPGVVAVCAGVVHSARDVQKTHTYLLDAFGSGDAGPLGYVEEGSVRWTHGMPAAAAPEFPGVLVKAAAGGAWPRVEIVMNYAGASGEVVRALRAQGVAGLVVAGTGNGTLHHDLEAALLEAQAAGIEVVRATRCLGARVLPHAGDRLPDSLGLTPVKARVALLLRLLAKTGGPSGPAGVGG